MSPPPAEKEKSLRLDQLRAEIARHDELYYRQAQPVISDKQYDQRKREMEDLENELDPLGLFSESNVKKAEETPPILVGDDRLDSFSSHCHLLPMLSLDNTYDKEEFFEFDQRLQRTFQNSELSYVVEPKIDGVAISLTYEKGQLVTATTRQRCGGRHCHPKPATPRYPAQKNLWFQDSRCAGNSRRDLYESSGV